MDPQRIDIQSYCTLRRSNSRTYKNQNLPKPTISSSRSRKLSDTTVPYTQLQDSYAISIDNTTATESCNNLIDLTDPIPESIKPEDIELRQLKKNNENRYPCNSSTLVKRPKDNQECIQEFRRIGSYCTLRPDQKRKLLLRTLSNLRKSNVQSDNTNHTLLLLRELEALEKESVDSKTSSLASLSSMDDESVDDPMKIEDYLLELDEYLEEIDRNCMCNEPNENQTINTNPLVNETNDDDDDDDNGSMQPGSSQRSNIHNSDRETALISTKKNTNSLFMDSDFLNPFRNSDDDDNYNCGDQCNLQLFNENEDNSNLNDRSKNNNIVRNDNDSSPDVSGFQSTSTADHMTRRHPFRNTISVPSESTTSLSSANELKLPQRHISWRRNSMRKTRPITLPDDAIQNFPPFNPTLNLSEHNSLENIGTDCEINMELTADSSAICTSDRHPLVISMESTDISQVPSIHQQIDQQLLSSNQNEESTDSDTNERNAILPAAVGNSLENEFLNVLTAVCSRNDSEPVLNSTTSVNNLQVRLPEDESDEYSERPRQLGRRGEARVRIVSITTETDSLGDQRIIVNHDQGDNSVSNAADTSQHFHTSRMSEPSSIATSRNTSPISIESSSASSSSVASSNNERPRARSSSDPETSLNDQEAAEKMKMWPCGFSRILAGSCCTLGLFNISRFSIFSIHYGANFIVQFLILSFIYGIPMLMLLMCLGAKIKSGPINIWRISPICKGIGISLVVVQTLVALYSAVSLAWILVYFRDSFLSQNKRFRWEEPYDYYRGLPRTNGTVKLAVTVADYFNGVVLQRHRLGSNGSTSGMGAIRFQLAFNLAILWIAVFIILCKGLRSYGKAVIGLMTIPLVGLISLSTKLLTMISFDSLQNLFQSTDWQDFFVNAQSWISAAQETFLTWLLVGASIISIYSKSTSLHEKSTILRRDAIVIALITIFGLVLGAVFGNTCVRILNDRGYYYLPGSFETLNSYMFLVPADAPVPPKFASIISKRLSRYSTVLGEGYSKSVNSNSESGFQAIRLVTELFPATLAAATQEQIGSGWSIIGFFTFFLFALGQLCAMWKPMASSLGNTTSAVLLSCVTGLLLATPLATECGINIIHFLDVILGGSWCVLLLWVGHIFAVFLVRGRPYTSDALVDDLHLTQTLSAFVALSWNVLLPIGLMLLCVLEYKQSNARDLYHWRGSTYWPMWVRKVGGFIQINVLMLVPIISLIQIYRYLSSGPPDILDRIQLLYRPSMSGTTGNRYPPSRTERPSPQRSVAATISLEPATTIDDAPPKYTPPPSYTTATGARLARMLRNSIRRSVRRIMGDGGNSRRPRLDDIPTTSHPMDSSLPPTYSTVLVDPMGMDSQNDIAPRVLYNSHTHRSHTLEHQRRTTTTSNAAARSQTLTARDVAQLLRPSRTQFQRASSLGACVDQTIRNSLQKSLSRSAEHLVLNAVPPDQSSAIQLNVDHEANRKTSVI